jgi:hypothetical protein
MVIALVVALLMAISWFLGMTVHIIDLILKKIVEVLGLLAHSIASWYHADDEDGGKAWQAEERNKEFLNKMRDEW